ncbi:MAG: thiamine pyrophosphate-dependent enzyme [Candidatus Humimicrobiaceae bacterium]
MTDQISKEMMIKFYKILKTIHITKDNIRLLVKNNEINAVKGICYGEEAIAVGVCTALKENDIVINTYDGVSNLIARGGNLNNIFAEMFGKSGGYNNGVRGHFNISVPELGVYSANSFSDTGVAIGIGFALSSKLREENKVIAAFYNNETANEGIIHESMNIASAFDLPMFFVCKNSKNLKGPLPEEFLEAKEFSMRALGYEIQGTTVNGMDIASVYNSAEKIAKNIRDNRRPAILECITNNYYEDLSGSGLNSNNKNIFDEAEFDDNAIIKNFSKILLDKSILTQKEMENVEQEVRALVKKAIEFSKSGGDPKPESLTKFMYADEYLNIPKPGWLS